MWPFENWKAKQDNLNLTTGLSTGKIILTRFGRTFSQPGAQTGPYLRGDGTRGGKACTGQGRCVPMTDMGLSPSADIPRTPGDPATEQSLPGSLARKNSFTILKAQMENKTSWMQWNTIEETCCRQKRNRSVTGPLAGPERLRLSNRFKGHQSLNNQQVLVSGTLLFLPFNPVGQRKLWVWRGISKERDRHSSWAICITAEAEKPYQCTRKTRLESDLPCCLVAHKCTGPPEIFERPCVSVSGKATDQRQWNHNRTTDRILGQTAQVHLQTTTCYRTTRTSSKWADTSFVARHWEGFHESRSDAQNFALHWPAVTGHPSFHHSLFGSTEWRPHGVLCQGQRARHHRVPYTEQAQAASRVFLRALGPYGRLHGHPATSGDPQQRPFLMCFFGTVYQLGAERCKPPHFSSLSHISRKQMVSGLTTTQARPRGRETRQTVAATGHHSAIVTAHHREHWKTQPWPSSAGLSWTVVPISQHLCPHEGNPFRLPFSNVVPPRLHPEGLRAGPSRPRTSLGFEQH